MALSIYLAGPDVFLPDALDIGRRKADLCRRFGFLGLFPMDQDESVGANPAKIFQANCRLMRRADIGIFNLTPFRGPSADAGTVFELGFMYALGRPVYGYSGVTAAYPERVEAAAGGLVERGGRRWDASGHAVEDFGLSDNLMIERAIHDSGGALATVEEKEGDPLAAWGAFRDCLKRIAADHPVKSRKAG